MAGTGDVGGVLVGFVRGERPPSALAELGMAFVETASEVSATQPPGLSSVQPSLADFAAGLVALAGEPEVLQRWANLILCIDVIDVEAIKAGSPGEFMLQAVGDASFQAAISDETLARASAFLDDATGAAAKDAARSLLLELPAGELARVRADVQAQAVRAGLSLEEIGTILDARADLPRELLPEEQAVLRAMLQRDDFPGRDALLTQVERVRVSGYCSCGCATAYLLADPASRPAPDAPRVVPGSADVLGPDGSEIGGLMVSTAAGYLSSLELYTYYGPISPIPPLTHIRFGDGPKPIDGS